MSNGPKYVDDSSISDTEDLLRRLPRIWVRYDEGSQSDRVTSQAFQDSNNGTPTSVSIASELSSTKELLKGHPGYGIGSLTAGAARGCNQGVCRESTPTDKAHAYLFGDKTKKNRRCLARECEVVVVPAEVAL